ncbi:MAG: hypothetical protein LC803_00685 [Acidobacteria bacterium]|nr:hypothetical protein [Acidobacteriota bacterium]
MLAAFERVKKQAEEKIMNNRASRNFILSLTLLVMTVVMVAIVKLSVAQVRQPARGSQEVSYEDRLTLVDALRREGLRGAAKIKGNYVQTFDPHPDWLSFDLEKLTQKSEAVVLGVPIKNRCKLTPDGQLIMTEYEVVVQEVLKGNVRQGDTVNVALVGGKVMFEDGTTAEVVTPGFKKMVNGKTYALYLSLYPIRSPVYDLTAGPQGMLELLDDGSGVISQARATDPVKNQVKDKDKKTFLKTARKFAKAWPRPGKCCS